MSFQSVTISEQTANGQREKSEMDEKSRANLPSSDGQVLEFVIIVVEEHFRLRLRTKDDDLQRDQRRSRSFFFRFVRQIIDRALLVKDPRVQLRGLKRKKRN